MLQTGCSHSTLIGVQTRSPGGHETGAIACGTGPLLRQFPNARYDPHGGDIEPAIAAGEFNLVICCERWKCFNHVTNASNCNNCPEKCLRIICHIFEHHVTLYWVRTGHPSEHVWTICCPVDSHEESNNELLAGWETFIVAPPSPPRGEYWFLRDTV